MDSVKVFAPATIANVGPGFDILGLAVTGLGDVVEAVKTDKLGVTIEAITGDGGRLPTVASKNTAGIAAAEALKIVGAQTGVSITLHKGLPLGSGLGSSAASAAAAAWAVALLNDFSDKLALLPACLAAESSISGYHADNIAPALLGGLTLIQSYQPLHIEPLPTPHKLHLVLVIPNIEIETAKARAITPQVVDLETIVKQMSHLSVLISACHRDDITAFGQAIIDEIIEPARAHLIPGFYEVKEAALKAGSLGCSISGGGPTVFAVTDATTTGEAVGQAMQTAFKSVGLTSVVHLVQVAQDGAINLSE